jgi:hypothetical protein
MLLPVNAVVDEAGSSMYSAHVRAAHQGLFRRTMVCGTIPLGYTGEEIPGEYTRQKRPRRRIIIDPETAPWIERIFLWFVENGKSLDQIARDLNADPAAPAPAKSLTGMWTHTLVRRHLVKACYRGYWTYGVAETKWSNKRDYARQVARPEPLCSTQNEDLRIVSDELWYRAQELLAKEKAKSGRRPRDGDRRSRPQVLRGLLVCPEHGRPLVVGGPHGRNLYCLTCRVIHADDRPLFSHLNRLLAVRLTCKTLAELVRADEELVAAIIHECQREAEAAQKPDSASMNRLKAQAQRLHDKIAFNRRNPGDTPEEQAETEKILRELRGELAQVQAELAIHTAAQDRVIAVPTEEEAMAMLKHLGQILISAASAEEEEDVRLARRIVERLLCGPIELHQMGQRKAYGGWLQGRMKVRLLSYLVERAIGVRAGSEADGVEVTIDYREPPKIVAQSERAKELYDQGWLHACIAKDLGVGRARLTAILKYWYESRGLNMPDGRARRGTLTEKHLSPPMYQTLADKVMPLYEQGMLIGDIAAQLRVDRNTLTSTIRWWHESRGLPVPDGRARRKRLLRKTSRKRKEARVEKAPGEAAEPR